MESTRRMVSHRGCVIYYITNDCGFVMQYCVRCVNMEGSNMRMFAKAYEALEPHMYDWKSAVKCQAKSKI